MLFDECAMLLEPNFVTHLNLEMGLTLKLWVRAGMFLPLWGILAKDPRVLAELDVP